MNSKALAAQKMVVNVRFDQQQFRLNMNKAGQSREMEDYDIVEHEPLVAATQQRSTDGISRVQSFAPKPGENEQALSEQYRFFGVSDNEHHAELKYRLDQGLAVAVGGIVKSYNESGSLIHAGQLLTFDRGQNSRVRVRGVPPNKRRFTFIAYDPTNLEHLKRGVVGKALNNSKNGSSMDVKLMPGAIPCGDRNYNALKSVEEQLQAVLAPALLGVAAVGAGGANAGAGAVAVVAAIAPLNALRQRINEFLTGTRDTVINP
jgi:hypothetical protein